MTNGNTIRQLIAATAAVFLGFGAVGATQEWSGSVTVSDDVADDITLDGTVEVTVASGSTFTLSGTISDKSGTAGKIKLLGGGTLVLAHTNDFTGGAYIDTGVLKVTVGNAVGTGPITIDGGTDKTSQLWFDFAKYTTKMTFGYPNTISVNHSGDSDHCQIKHSCGNTTNKRNSLKLDGVIACAGDLHFHNDNTIQNNDSHSITFSESVTVEGRLDFSRASTAITFSKQVKAKILSSASADGHCGDAPITLKGQNEIGRFEVYRAQITGGRENAFSGAPVHIHCCDGKAHDGVSLGGYNQTLAYLQTYGFEKVANAGQLPAIRSSAAKTLTLTGGVAKAVFWGHLGCIDKTTKLYYPSLRIDASAQPDFTQVVTNGNNLMNGTITVDAGHLVLNGATSCTNLSGIAVNGGSFTFDTTYNGEVPALNSLSTLTVKKGAKLTLKGENLFNDDMSLALTIESGAQIDIPAGTYSVSSLTVDGRTWEKGTYSSTLLTMFSEGVTLNVTSGTAGGSTTDKNWTGDSQENKLLDTAGNWEEKTVPPLNYGLLKATLKGGNGMDYADGVWLNQIVNGIEPSTENPVDPFVIKPASEGATLHLSRGLVSTEKTQLILNGHITDLPERSTSAENHIYYKPAITGGVANAIQPTGFPKNGALPLVLINAVLDLPMDIVSVDSQYVMLSVADTTNAVRKIICTGNNFWVFADSGSVTRCEDYFSSSGSCSFRGTGEYVLGDSASFTRGFSVQDGCTVSLATTNSLFVGSTTSTREGIHLYKGTLNMLADNVLADTLQIAPFTSAYSAVLELNATTQTVGVVCFDAGASLTTSYLHGDYPALLKVTGKNRGSEALVSKLRPPYVSARITGGLSIHFTGEGTNEVFTLAGRDFESCGDLTVSGKKLELAADAKWLNGTNFTAKGNGTLKFSGSDQVNSNFAVLHMEGTGKVEIPANVTNFVYLAETNGVLLAAGNYTGDGGPSDATVIPQLTGTGVLSVRCADPVKTSYEVKDDREPQIKTVVVSNSWVNENVPLDKTINDTPEGGNGFPYWKNYVLGMNPKDPNSLPIIKGVQNANPNKLAFTLGNVTYNADSGVLAEYTIKESTAINGTYTEKATNTVGQVVEFDLPKDGILHYYQAVIRYRDAK